MRSLFTRLSLVFLAILLVLGFATLWLANRSSQNYQLEFTQKLNRPLAMYMVQNIDLVVDGRLNEQGLETLAPHIMVINPSVEVYLLDARGQVLWPQQESSSAATHLHKTTARNEASVPLVSMEAIHRFLSNDDVYPLLGSHPARPGENTIFSAWPVFASNQIDRNDNETSEPLGYVYVVLASERHATLLASIHSNYSIRVMLNTLGSVLALTLCGGLFVFFMLTRRLRMLADEVYNANTLSLLQTPESAITAHSPAAEKNTRHFSGDEIDLLAKNYSKMKDELLSQYRLLEQGDVSRREFVASISHDLRTPLTSLQNYLETALAKWSTMSQRQRFQFVKSAHKQSLRLQHLISRLFEISRLNSPDFAPQRERFSMLELAFDCAQDFEVRAQKKAVTIYVKASLEDSSIYDVFADIALIQRVLENLLANAVRHTAEQGTVEIALDAHDETHLHIQVENTGCELSAEQIRTFSKTGTCGPADSRSAKATDSSGLGLTIVQRILHLHGSHLSLGTQAKPCDASEPEARSSVSFCFLLERARNNPSVA